jgi:hypothetical protein
MPNTRKKPKNVLVSHFLQKNIAGFMTPQHVALLLGPKIYDEI